MNYRLSFQNETYPVEDLRLPAAATPAYQSIGKPVSFVSPIRLTIGRGCMLLGDSVAYQLLVGRQHAG